MFTEPTEFLKAFPRTTKALNELIRYQQDFSAYQKLNLLRQPYLLHTTFFNYLFNSEDPAKSIDLLNNLLLQNSFQPAEIPEASVRTVLSILASLVTDRPVTSPTLKYSFLNLFNNMISLTMHNAAMQKPIVQLFLNEAEKFHFHEIDAVIKYYCLEDWVITKRIISCEQLCQLTENFPFQLSKEHDEFITHLLEADLPHEEKLPLSSLLLESIKNNEDLPLYCAIFQKFIDANLISRNNAFPLLSIFQRIAYPEDWFFKRKSDAKEYPIRIGIHLLSSLLNVGIKPCELPDIFSRMKGYELKKHITYSDLEQWFFTDKIISFKRLVFLASELSDEYALNSYIAFIKKLFSTPLSNEDEQYVSSLIYPFTKAMNKYGNNTYSVLNSMRDLLPYFYLHKKTLDAYLVNFLVELVSTVFRWGPWKTQDFKEPIFFYKFLIKINSPLIANTIAQALFKKRSLEYFNYESDSTSYIDSISCFSVLYHLTNNQEYKIILAEGLYQKELYDEFNPLACLCKYYDDRQDSKNAYCMAAYNIIHAGLLYDHKEITSGFQRIFAKKFKDQITAELLGKPYKKCTPTLNLSESWRKSLLREVVEDEDSNFRKFFNTQKNKISGELHALQALKNEHDQLSLISPNSSIPMIDFKPSRPDDDRGNLPSAGFFQAGSSSKSPLSLTH